VSTAYDTVHRIADEIANEPREYLVVVSPEGEELHRIAGTATQVDIPNPNPIPPGSILVHNHPPRPYTYERTFSLPDIRSAMKVQAREMWLASDDLRLRVMPPEGQEQFDPLDPDLDVALMALCSVNTTCLEPPHKTVQFITDLLGLRLERLS
jgi:hypothetical protein